MTRFKLIMYGIVAIFLLAFLFLVFRSGVSFEKLVFAGLALLGIYMIPRAFYPSSAIDDAASRTRVAEMDKSLREKIENIAKEGRKIEAIKELRAATGLGLAEAKGIVDVLAENASLQGDVGAKADAKWPERMAPPEPDPDGFWEVVGRVKGVPFDDRAGALKSELGALEPDALIAFYADYRRALKQAYRWDLWAAAYVINGGCSDDGFDYFCDWLISKGRDAYEAALADPASLINVVSTMGEEEEADFEEFRYVVQEVFEEKTESTMPMLDMEPYGEPAGTDWEEDDVEDMFPELAKWANER